MKTILFSIALFGVTVSEPACAEWVDQAPFGLNSRTETAYQYGVQYPGSAYIVAGSGSEYLGERRRYWGGPYWVTCGRNPPFETYSMSCRRTVGIVAVPHHRRITVHLK